MNKITRSFLMILTTLLLLSGCNAPQKEKPDASIGKSINIETMKVSKEKQKEPVLEKFVVEMRDDFTREIKSLDPYYIKLGGNILPVTNDSSQERLDKEDFEFLSWKIDESYYTDSKKHGDDKNLYLTIKGAANASVLSGYKELYFSDIDGSIKKYEFVQNSDMFKENNDSMEYAVEFTKGKENRIFLHLNAVVKNKGVILEYKESK